MSHIIVPLAILLLSVMPAFAQAAPTSQRYDVNRLNQLFDLLESNQKMMGMVSIRKDGQRVYDRALGYGQISGTRKVKNTEETLFPIASLTKTFTAVIIFQLIEEKKLTLDTKLSRFFPRIPNADKITIGQMLAHRSGIHNYTLDADYQDWKLRPHSREELLSRFAGYKPEFDPGEKEVYSNTPYILLGYIIERLTGSSYAKQLKARIINKIDLKNTLLDSANKPSRRNRAISYTFAGGKWHAVTKRTTTGITAAAGGIVSTTADINRFLVALFADKLISAESLAIMTKPVEVTGNDSAMGIDRIAFNNKTKVGYTYDGSLDAFGSVFFYVPSDKLGIVITTNGENYPSGEIFWMVMKILYGAPVSLPSFTPITLPAERLSSYEGTFALEGTDLKLTFKKQDLKLVVRVTGEPAVPLDAVSDTKFQFAADGVLIEFLPDPTGEVNRVTYFKDRQKTVWARVP
jgi:D-alanyl-D-alanine carboxypeptidase